MNFPHETENSYLSGGNCLNLGVNPSGEVYFKEFLYLCRKPPVHNLYAAIGKAFEHETTSSVSLSATHTPWQELSKS